MKAFPLHFKHPTTGLIVEEQGMDLRDYFASRIVVVIMGSEDISYRWVQEICCESAYEWADEMMKAREVKNV